MLGLVHDYVYLPAMWLVSRKTRAHMAYVRAQNDHLDGSVHATPDPGCDYCVARDADRRRIPGHPGPFLPG